MPYIHPGRNLHGSHHQLQVAHGLATSRMWLYTTKRKKNIRAKKYFIRKPAILTLNVLGVKGAIFISCRLAPPPWRLVKLILDSLYCISPLVLTVYTTEIKYQETQS